MGWKHSIFCPHGWSGSTAEARKPSWALGERPRVQARDAQSRVDRRAINRLDPTHRALRDLGFSLRDLDDDVVRALGLTPKRRARVARKREPGQGRGVQDPLRAPLPETLIQCLREVDRIDRAEPTLEPGKLPLAREKRARLLAKARKLQANGLHARASLRSYAGTRLRPELRLQLERDVSLSRLDGEGHKLARRIL